VACIAAGAVSAKRSLHRVCNTKACSTSLKASGERGRTGLGAYFSPSWTAFQAERGRDFSVIVDGISN
jgi:hypothetical protein